MFDENKGSAVACVLIAGDKSFSSLPSTSSTDSTIPSAIPDLSKTLKDILVINDTVTDNGSVISSPEDFGINPTKGNQTHALSVDFMQ